MIEIHQKLAAISDKLHDIDKTLAVNTELLDHHIKRTELLEQALEEHRAHTDAQLEIALTPIKTIQSLATAAKSISAIAAGLAALAGLGYALLRTFAQ